MQQYTDLPLHFLMSILSSIADGVTAQEPSGKLIYANTTAAQIIGYPSPEALLAAPLSDIMQRFEIFDEHGNPFPLAQLPSRLALQGHQNAEVLLRFLVKATGEERWSITKAQPVFDAGGQVILAVNTFHDVTALKKSEARIRLLQQVTSAFSQTITLEDVASVVLVQGLTALQARAAVVTLLNEDEQALEIISAHNVRSDLRQRYQTLPLATHTAVTDVVRTGEPLWIETREQFGAQYPNEIHLLATTGLQAAAAIPLVAQGRIIGALGLSFQTPQAFSLEDREFILALAQHCSQALERARLYQQAQDRFVQLQAIYALSSAVSRADLSDDVYALAIRGLVNDLGADRASLLLFDAEGVMRFKAWHQLSDKYRQLADGHSPWSRDSANPQPILIGDVTQATTLGELHSVIVAEGIAALAFIPLLSDGKLIGKFMVYYDQPHTFGNAEVQFAQTLASHIAFTIQRQAIEQARTQLLASEQQARLAAEKANALQLQFLAMISHELRTPLTSIKGFTSTLLATDVSFTPEQSREFVQIMGEEADKLTELVEQLLDLSRLEAGNLRIDVLRHEVTAILDVAHAQLESLTRHHQLSIWMAGPLPPVMADRKRIAQVLVNLVGNAAKYSAPDTKIIISVYQAGQWIQLDVRDEGYGIPVDEQAFVFDVFRQGRHEPRQRGAGLGLAICKGIVEAHHGRLWIEETSPAGTTMSFVLPVAEDTRH